MCVVSACEIYQDDIDGMVSQKEQTSSLFVYLLCVFVLGVDITLNQKFSRRSDEYCSQYLFYYYLIIIANLIVD